MKQAVHYVEVYELANRGAVDPAPSEEVAGILLVGTEHVLHFYCHQTSYGEDSTYIFPAIHNGQRAWPCRDVWSAAKGYSASGTNEYILPFEQGVTIFLEREVFAFPTPDNN